MSARPFTLTQARHEGELAVAVSLLPHSVSAIQRNPSAASSLCSHGRVRRSWTSTTPCLSEPLQPTVSRGCVVFCTNDHVV